MSRLGALSPRERLLIGLVLPLAILMAGWRFGWLPVEEARLRAEAEIAAYAQIVEAADRAAAGPAVVAAPPPSEPLATRVTAAAEAAGIALTRLEPEGEMLRVTLGEANYPDVMLWLADLESTRGALLSAIEIDRRIVPGTVSARVLLEDAQ